jgi:hypothetical protein
MGRLLTGSGRAKLISLEERMEPSAFQVHKSWFIRAVLVLMVTVLADGAVVWFAQRPILWAALIAGSLPLSMYFFVAVPVLRDEGRKAGLDRP